MTAALIHVRRMEPSDAPAVARLHAESWRRTYRGVLPDAFLDGDVFAEREAAWRTLLAGAPPGDAGFVAVEGDRIVGLAHADADGDATWGTFVTALHVDPDRHGRGIGRALLAAVARDVVRRGGPPTFALTVFAVNTAACAFYARVGGQAVERLVAAAPGGGTIDKWRYAWPDARVLLEGDGGR